jgi:ech hydrogenase subunit B
MIEIVYILLAPIFGGLLYGAERVLRARMQNRVGPPILQPFYDMFKLIDKRPIMVNSTHIVLGIMHFITLWIAVAMIIFGVNFLYVIFTHLLSSIFLVLAGFSVKSAYSNIGANRELLSIVAYEPILIFVAVGFYLINNSFDINIVYANKSMLTSLIFLFFAFLLIVPIKLKKSPFDATEAHQEIVGGVEIEYSGIFFEFIYMAKWLEYVFVYLILFLFAGDSYIIAIFLGLFLFLVVNLVDNSTARVRIDHLLKIVLSIGLVLSIINLVGLAYEII